MKLWGAHLTYVERTINMLTGILEGIAADYTLTDREIHALRDWLDKHFALFHLYPFSELKDRVDDILRDGRVDESEHEELLEWCATYINANNDNLLEGAAAVQKLHGFFHTVHWQDNLGEVYVKDFNDWLHDNHSYKDIWPFSEGWAMVSRILEDGRVEPHEVEELKRFAEAFTERIAIPQPTDEIDPWYMRSNSPSLKTSKLFCDDNVEFCIEHRSFCFTGRMEFGKRKQYENSVVERGGILLDRITKKLDWLVVGGINTKAWKFSTYGRKLEAARALKLEHGQPEIISESLFNSKNHQSTSHGNQISEVLQDCARRQDES